MKKKSLTILGILLSSVLLISSCSKDEENENKFNFKQGLFITNEGVFQTGTGTVSFYDYSTSSVNHDIFRTANGKDLGNVLQSMTLINDSIAYLVVNNAAKVEVVDAVTFKSLSTITGLTLPRYLLPVSASKAYVSDWDGSVRIIGLNSNTITGSIPAGIGPDLMMKSGKYVYVLNSGGFSVDHTVTVIDNQTDQVVKTLELYDRPTGIAEDAGGKIWVLCSGKGFNGWPDPEDTQAHLVKINPDTWKIEFEMKFTDSSVHPEKLAINPEKNTLFFLHNNGIYKYSTDLSVFLPVRVCSHANLYSLAYDQGNGYLLASDPSDYQSDGWVYRFRAADGVLVDSIQAGIIPGGMVIKNR